MRHILMHSTEKKIVAIFVESVHAIECAAKVRYEPIDWMQKKPK